MARHDVETLLALRAACGLEDDERKELERALHEDPAIDDGGFDRAAAALALAMEPTFEPPPADLAARLNASAAKIFPSRAVTHDPTAGLGREPAATPEDGADEDAAATANVTAFVPPARVATWSGWLAAAAAMALAALAWWPLDTTAPVPAPVEAPPATEPTSAELRQELLSLPGTTTLAWSATADPAATGAGGDVVWNERLQRGYMRFDRLAVNDPTEFQYQLWIFDATRDERYPVDGGVFDIGGDGQVVVPIRARLPVREAALFAVTVEPPGGVVVSSRERIALLAEAAP